MTNDVDWEAIARQVGAIRENTALGPYSEIGGDDIACKALVAIMGDEFWQEAVDSYVAGERGSAVIRSILWLLHPRPAMDRCYAIYKSETDQDTRRYALTLLVYVADYSILPWVTEFLGDPDEDINLFATWMLDQLLMSMRVAPTDEFDNLLEMAESHRSQRVRDQLADLHVRERLEKSDWRVAS